jgi:hypothetical protein
MEDFNLFIKVYKFHDIGIEYDSVFSLLLCIKFCSFSIILLIDFFTLHITLFFTLFFTHFKTPSFDTLLDIFLYTKCQKPQFSMCF